VSKPTVIFVIVENLNGPARVSQMPTLPNSMPELDQLLSALFLVALLLYFIPAVFGFGRSAEWRQRLQRGHSHARDCCGNERDMVLTLTPEHLACSNGLVLDRLRRCRGCRGQPGNVSRMCATNIEGLILKPRCADVSRCVVEIDCARPFSRGTSSDPQRASAVSGRGPPRLLGTSRRVQI
jgi:hypothetical protein